MTQCRLVFARRVLGVLFLFSTIMIFVNSAVFFDNIVSTTSASVNMSQESSGDTNHTTADDIKLHRLRFNRTKRFVRRPWPDKTDCSNFTIRRVARRSLPPIALASYPGSGNTWVRYLIEAASGVYTGSIYKDASLYLQGFWGELADWDAGVTCVQKTHDAGADHIRSFSGGRGIFLNRNPYEAILSFHNFLYGGHTGHAPSANFRRAEWPDFLVDQTRRWLAMAVNWTQYSTELLTVHYEELKEDPLPQLRRILRFLRLPVNEKRLACIQKYPHSKFHRKGQYDEPWDENMVFPERIRLPMDRAIRYVDYLTRRKGNRAVPLESYSYYNHSGRRSTSPTATQDASWSQWLTDQWGYRVVQSFLEDPLTKQLREEAISGSFYVSNIPFDSRYQESDQLQQDYNAGPPPFIQRILSRASNGEKPKPRNL